MKLIPNLSPHITIEKIESNDNFFIVYNSFLDKRIKINLITKQLLDLINNKRSIQEITNKINNINSASVDIQTIHSIITNLQNQGIIQTEKEITKTKFSYIWFKITLIPQKKVNQISSVFLFLFVKHIYPIIIVSSFFLIAMYYLNLSESVVYAFFTPVNILLYIPIAYLSKFLHEFGHASAVKKFGLIPGSIGFGFYLLSPVFYANVSCAWSLPSFKRIIINIAGMYFQLLFSLLLATIFILTSNKWFLIISFFNSLSIIPNLNPFIRYDGYWILSDALNINYLIRKAENKFSEAFNFLIKSNNASPFKSKQDYFLLIYFLLNKSIVIIFLIFILLIKRNSLIEFPVNFYKFIISLVDGSEVYSFTLIKNFLFENIYSIIFYTLCVAFIRQVIHLVKTYIFKFKLTYADK